ncbi:MAG: HAD-IA family hydrolase [Proteobacteria bacterium]|jgi:phosphoglycolate phosphatase|nr:HAD-IA family hydrolase [Pseudomonadota bacterium]
MSKPGKLIVFDWDGTLMDSEARIVACLREAIRETGLPERSNSELSNIIGLGLREALQTLYPEGDDPIYDTLVSHYRHHFLNVDPTPSPVFDGAEMLLQKLQAQGHYLAIATGKGRHGLDKVLLETGLDRYFDYTRCADEAFSKPHPQMLLDIMTQLGVEAGSTLMIGDTEYDIKMAHNARVAALAVSYGVHDHTRLLEANPLDCVTSLSELDNWLDNYLSHAA